MEYLIVDYSLVTIEDGAKGDYSKRQCRIVTENELFELLNDSKYNPPQISVYKLGDCIIDWS